eukprot:GGOE01013635.1.p1 GENE.GGOE01013635.1~~GGOE01013635.1.p1  ORF type:complete len:260 (+),score=34.29 GGOE01013635.1:39-818(+)
MEWASTEQIYTQFFYSTEIVPSANHLLKLNKSLRGYARYLIIQDPVTLQQYSVGMRHVLSTEGGKVLLANLKKNVFRTHKRHLRQWLCTSVINGVICPLQERCPNIHVTLEGYQKRRIWVDAALRTGRRGCSPSCACIEDVGCFKDCTVQQQCQLSDAYLCQPDQVLACTDWNECATTDFTNLEEQFADSNDPYTAHCEQLDEMAHQNCQPSENSEEEELATQRQRMINTRQRLHWQVNQILKQCTSELSTRCHPNQLQ